MKKFTFSIKPTTETMIVSDQNHLSIGAPVDEGGLLANNGDAYGIVLDTTSQIHEGRWRQRATVMTAGVIDLIDAQQAFGAEYTDACKTALSNISFCDNHKLVADDGGWPADLPKPSVGGYGYTESYDVVLFSGDVVVNDDFELEFEPFEVDNGEKYTVIIDGVVYNDVEAKRQ